MASDVPMRDADAERFPYLAPPLASLDLERAYDRAQLAVVAWRFLRSENMARDQLNRDLRIRYGAAAATSHQATIVLQRAKPVYSDLMLKRIVHLCEMYLKPGQTVTCIEQPSFFPGDEEVDIGDINDGIIDGLVGSVDEDRRVFQLSFRDTGLTITECEGESRLAMLLRDERDDFLPESDDVISATSLLHREEVRRAIGMMIVCGFVADDDILVVKRLTPELRRRLWLEDEPTRLALAAHLVRLPGVLIDWTREPMLPWRGLKFFHGTDYRALQVRERPPVAIDPINVRIGDKVVGATLSDAFNGTVVLLGAWNFPARRFIDVDVDDGWRRRVITVMVSDIARLARHESGHSMQVGDYVRWSALASDPFKPGTGTIVELNPSGVCAVRLRGTDDVVRLPLVHLVYSGGIGDHVQVVVLGKTETGVVAMFNDTLMVRLDTDPSGNTWTSMSSVIKREPRDEWNHECALSWKTLEKPIKAGVSGETLHLTAFTTPVWSKALTYGPHVHTYRLKKAAE
ncbi:MAG: hypothetical protein Q7V62_16620, partial [Actinomycetota bacterium]|nr:hypothetical protein [Actinomycetota bacterium]